LTARAVALYQKGNLRQACPIFADLAARQPSNRYVHLYLLGCSIYQGDMKGITKERAALRKLAPAGTKAHALAADWLASSGYCAAAEEEFALAPQGGAADAVEFALAQCYQGAGDVERAVKGYRKALELNPEKEEYYLSLAILLMGTSETEEAGKVLVNAVKRYPQSLRILVTMSLLHLELGFADRARVGYEKARAIAPDSAMVWKLLGRIQHAEGTYEDAVKSFERAAAIDPKDAQTYLFMGMALLRIEGGADRALEAFLRAIELDPELLEARLQAASIYLQTKQHYAKAASYLEKVVAAAPDFVRARQLLMQAYYRLGWNEKAAAQAKKLRELTEQAPADPGPAKAEPKSH
jgi:tetratricopeptide (TPR) repeat protein